MTFGIFNLVHRCVLKFDQNIISTKMSTCFYNVLWEIKYNNKYQGNKEFH
jgi:hypothetical protein